MKSTIKECILSVNEAVGKAGDTFSQCMKCSDINSADFTSVFSVNHKSKSSIEDALSDFHSYISKISSEIEDLNKKILECQAQIEESTAKINTCNEDIWDYNNQVKKQMMIYIHTKKILKDLIIKINKKKLK